MLFPCVVGVGGVWRSPSCRVGTLGGAQSIFVSRRYSQPVSPHVRYAPAAWVSFAATEVISQPSVSSAGHCACVKRSIFSRVPRSRTTLAAFFNGSSTVLFAQAQSHVPERFETSPTIWIDATTLASPPDENTISPVSWCQS